MKIAALAVFLGVLLLAPLAFAQQPKVLTNHLGYETTGPKHAVVLGYAGQKVTAFSILDTATGKPVLQGDAVDVGPVDQWKNWHFWTIEFSGLQTQGNYQIEVQTSDGPIRCEPFAIQRDLLERNTLSNVIYYFKGQRCSGLLDKADHKLKLEGVADSPTFDVHGGWYDATGDYGKHLSHLSFSTYFNPQQIPFTDWVLFRSYDELGQRDTAPDHNFTQYRRRLLDEAMYGADYLVRVKDPDGSFFRSVDAPGGDKAPTDRMIARERKNYILKLSPKDAYPPNAVAPTADASKVPFEIGFRNGAGVAIAALARASTFSVSGDFSSADYLKAARDAFAFLQQHNVQYQNDGKDNIVDDYTVLMAATELYRATQSPQYKSVADQRASNLMNRLISNGAYQDYWRADDGTRPFFHAADAGLPIVSLLNYSEITDAQQKTAIVNIVRRSLEFEMRTTNEVANPFGYARQLVQDGQGNHHTAFFFPHDTEAAPWWQGENARLASLAAAARMAIPYFSADAAFQLQLRQYAWNQLNWILGLNPYDSCMLRGTGRNNISYKFFNSYQYTGAPGGICNGITAGITNPHDIDFDLGFATTGKDEDWRWGEQWLPHATWYLLAISFEQ